MEFDRLLEAGIANVALLEDLYVAYQQDPNSVDRSWRELFTDLQKSPDGNQEEKKEEKPKEPTALQTVAQAPADMRIFNLINAYRHYGHLKASINPIATDLPRNPAELSLSSLGFQESEKTEYFPTCGILEEEQAPLEKIIARMEEIYSDKIGVEYMSCERPELISWLQEHIEPTGFRPNLDIDQKRSILQELNKSELFESFLHTKFVGQKRFSLEGSETLIPMLAAVVYEGSEHGVQEVVIGMAHRGRLNVLVNTLQKSYSQVFGEFEDSYIADSFEGSGDVKYHKGYSSVLQAENGKKVEVMLMANPSHLESVDSVVQGQVRARQVMIGDENRGEKILPVLIHGDAAVAGQGIVYETLQLYNLAGYRTGGTIHFVINNQIGFTTLPKDARSTRYCTDIAKAFGAPVFHVNAEDPEGCVYATILAMQLRNRFHCDVFVELNGYRKFGHNEGDEPAFTQPLEYQLIRQKRPIRELYRDFLVHQGVLEKYVAESLEEKFNQSLSQALKGVQLQKTEAPAEKEESRERVEKVLFTPLETGVEKQQLQEITEKITTVPEAFSINKKLARLVKDRQSMAYGTKPCDWGMAEAMAFGSLLWNGHHVRISGQDSRRGTFSHRHAMWMDQKNARKYFPLSRLHEKQGRFDVFNSPLSEYGVLGFEFGYALANPEGLVVWEAQFGDFANGAEIIIDQYIATAEQKWGMNVPLALFLPHGYEGQGPEHSSARIERFLGLAGNYNMLVCNPSTPAQMFHLIRRQCLSPLKKPLIVFTPKSLLRHPKCVSDIADLTKGSFEEIIDDTQPKERVKRIVLCSGKVYYDLLVGREENQVTDMALIRVEQLYPFHLTKAKELLSQYTNVEQVYWVQEEPSNMGAWKFVRPMIDEVLADHLSVKYIGRPPSASPATGSFSRHKKELSDLLSAVFRSEEQPFYEMSYHTVPV